MCRLFNWDSHETPQNIGGYRFKYDTFPIFVTYKKHEYISDALDYDDHFINPRTFSWISRKGITASSIEIKRLKEGISRGIPAQLFVKKGDADKGQHYYLGEITPKDYYEGTMTDQNKERNVVNIIFELKDPVRADIYDFIVEN